MARASDFGQERTATLETLLASLVEEITSQQGGSGEHEILFKEVLRQSKYHQFSDSEPRKVEFEYLKLSEKLESTAQYEKQEALLELTDRWKSLKNNSNTIEFNHRILSLLLCASNSPINSIYTPIYPLQDLVDQGDERSDLKSLAKEFQDEFCQTKNLSLNNYSSSDLSDWSGEEDESSGDDSDKENRPNQAESIPSSSESEDFPENPIDDWMISIQYDSLKDLLQNTHQEESSSHLAEDSLLWKLQKQNADREKTEQICISDLQIIEEAFAIMRGCKIHGKVFRWEDEEKRIKISKSICKANLSISLGYEILQDLVRTGNYAIKLWDTIGDNTLKPDSPTLIAFKSALTLEMQEFASEILHLERNILRTDFNNKLINFIEAQKSFARKMHILCILLNAIEEGVEIALNPSEISTNILDAIYSVLKEVSLHNSASGQIHMDMILKLMVTTMKPLLNALDNWLLHGILPLYHTEFFIEQVENMSVDDVTFWEKAYKSRKIDGSSKLACPLFLVPYAQNILYAGKSMIMLQHERNLQNGSKPVEAIDRYKEKFQLDASGDLQTHFKKCLKWCKKEKKSDAMQSKSSPNYSKSSAFLEKSNFQIGEQMRSTTKEFYAKFHRHGAIRNERGSLDHKEQYSDGQKRRQQKVPEEIWKKAEPLLFHTVPVTYEYEKQAEQFPINEKVHLFKSENAWEDDIQMRDWMLKISNAMSRDSIEAEDKKETQSHHTYCTKTFLPVYKGLGNLLWKRGGNLVKQEFEEGYDDSNEPGRNFTQPVPSAEVIIETHLLTHISQKVKAIEKEVLIHMRDYQEIGKQLEIIREIFICEDSALMPMKRDLLKFLVARIPLDEIEVPDLQLILEDSLKNSNTEQILPNVKNMTVHIDIEERAKILSKLEAAETQRKARETSISGSGNNGQSEKKPTQMRKTLAELVALNLRLSLPWPLHLIVSTDSLRIYNRIMVFLLQLKWAKEVVNEARQILEFDRDKLSIALMLSHMLTSVEQFTSSNLMSNWAKFKQVQESASHISQILNAHEEFLISASELCMASPDTSWRVVYSILRKLMDLSLQFHDLALAYKETGELAEKQFERLKLDFRDRHRYFLKALTNKSLKIGVTSGLHDLVLLLDFNNFYRT